ncbi:DMT family transporter [Promethearchaeum syntrophicum]|uniref:DMT family transporter n=1 Tax=Promethearchaeum syntrophicum TaxID=2594042 RepID=A0A5B9DAH9_9ARCH|nr:DMT family transporter [Candidatus Prometheoarchaeum syntrophicum]
MKKRTSYLLSIITMIFWGTAFPFSKYIIDKSINPVVFLALRMSFALLFCIGYILFTKQARKWFLMFKRNFWHLLIIGIMLYASSYIIQYFGVSYTTAINQTIISNTTTFFVVVLNFVLYRHKPTKIFVFSMIIGFLGVLLIMLNDNLQISSETIVGDLLTLLAFFFWSLYIVFNRKISIKESPQFVTLSVFIWVCFLLVPLSFGFGMVEEIKLLNFLDWSVIAYLGLICSGAATLFYTIALSNEDIPSENLALIGFLIPVVGIFTSILLLEGENLNWRIVVGCILVLISVFIIESKNSRNSDKN